ncbi:hypothetical protein, partial [Zhongshania sp.]
FLNSATSSDSELYFEKLENAYYALKSQRDILKENLLSTGTRGLISLEQMVNGIDFITEIKQLNEQWYKAIKILSRLEIDTRKSNTDDDVSTQEDPEKSEEIEGGPSDIVAEK